MENKLTKEQIQEIKNIRENGESLREIALKFKVSPTTIRYHLNKENLKKNYKKWYNSLSKEKKKEIFKTNNQVARDYRRNRYHSDEEYRKKCIEASTNWRKNKSNSIAEVVKGGKY